MKATFAILGGGIAGLTAAIALKQIGIEAPVLEAAPAFRPVGAGIALAANAMSAYQRLGIDRQLIEAGHILRRFTIYDHRGGVLNSVRTDDLEGHPVSLAIHRAELHRVLSSQMNPGQIVMNKRSKDLSSTASGYKVSFEDGSELDARYLIVAEGIHSVIRNKIAPGTVERYAGYTCWRGIADNTTLAIDESSETWGAEGRFGIVPLGGNKAYWFACKNAAANDAAMQSWGAGELEENFRSYHPPIPSVIRATPDEQILWNDIIDLKPMPRYAFGNLALIGDAAHAATPNMGQGACQAVEDAVILAGCLKNHAGVEDAFTDFQQRRLKRTHAIVRQSWTMGRIAQIENRWMIFVRNTLSKAVPARFNRKQLEKLYRTDFP